MISTERSLSKRDLIVIAILSGLVLFVYLPRLSLYIFPHLGDNAQYYLRILSLVKEGAFIDYESAEPSLRLAMCIPPMLPLMLAAPALVSDAVAPIKIMFYLLQVLAIIPVYLLLVSMVRSHVISSLLLTLLLINSAFIEMFPVLNTDILFIGLFALTLLFSFKLIENSLNNIRLFPAWIWFLVGCLGGSTILLRYVGIAIAFTIIIWAIIVYLFDRGRNKIWNYLALIAGVGFSLLALEVWFQIISDSSFYFGYLANTAEKTSEGLAATSGLVAHMINRSIYIAWTSGELLLGLNHPEYYRAYFLVAPLLPVAAIGLWSKRKSFKHVSFIFLLLPYVGLFLYARATPNHRYLLLPVLLFWIFFYEGLREITEWLIGRKILDSVKPTLTAALSIVVLVLMIPPFLVSLRCYKHGPQAQIPYLPQSRRILTAASYELLLWLQDKEYDGYEVVLRKSVYPYTYTRSLKGIGTTFNQQSFDEFCNTEFDRYVRSNPEILVLQDHNENTDKYLDKWIENHEEYLVPVKEIDGELLYKFNTDKYMQDIREQKSHSREALH